MRECGDLSWDSAGGAEPNMALDNRRHEDLAGDVWPSESSSGVTYLRRMQGQTLLVACVLLALVSSCASEPETRGSPLSNTSRARRGTSGRAAVTGDDHAMELQMSLGVLDERAVDTAMAPHLPAMVECFDRLGDARRYLSGQIVLRFVVEASGSVSDVHVIKNELGNHPVERCLIDVGRHIVFPPPEGNRRTDFEYSMRF